jgi:hypothetical protein
MCSVSRSTNAANPALKKSSGSYGIDARFFLRALLSRDSPEPYFLLPFVLWSANTEAVTTRSCLLPVCIRDAATEAASLLVCAISLCARGEVRVSDCAAAAEFLTLTA